MFQNSRDILFIVISSCIAILTLFIVWCVYYFAMMLRDIKKTTFQFRRKIEKVLNFFDKLKDKAETAGEISSAVTKSVIEIIKFAKEKRGNQKEKRKKENKE